MGPFESGGGDDDGGGGGGGLFMFCKAPDQKKSHAIKTWHG